MNETSKILNQDEKVIWEGSPQFTPYIISIFPVMVFGFFWTTISSSILYVFLFVTKGTPWFVIAFVSLFVLIGLLMLIGNPIYILLLYKRIWYVITDKRLVLQGGLMGRDFDIVDYDKMESANVNVGLIDKMFGKNSGSISIYANRLVAVAHTDSRGYSSSATSNVPFIFSYITDPYAVFELLKKVSFDVKADINYPNAMRPPENKGYQTEYKSEDTK